MPTLTHALGNNLRRERERKDWSRAVLARRSGVSTATISRVEIEGHTPKLAALQSLAVALDIQVQDLLEEVAK